ELDAICEFGDESGAREALAGLWLISKMNRPTTRSSKHIIATLTQRMFHRVTEPRAVATGSTTQRAQESFAQRLSTGIRSLPLAVLYLCLEREAAVEGAVLVRSLPGIAGCVTVVESFDRVADSALTQGNQRIVPDEVRHAAAEIVRHRFDIDCRARRADVVRFAFVLESNRSASYRDYVT